MIYYFLLWITLLLLIIDYYYYYLSFFLLYIYTVCTISDEVHEHVFCSYFLKEDPVSNIHKHVKFISIAERENRLTSPPSSNQQNPTCAHSPATPESESRLISLPKEQQNKWVSKEIKNLHWGKSALSDPTSPGISTNRKRCQGQQRYFDFN